MNIKSSPVKFVLSILLSILAFYINYYYANKGLYPIDTFSFFDTSYYITEGQHPIKDFWVISGIFVDYFQALFFYIFGLSWNSYVFHASFFNVIVSLFFFYFLNQFNKNILFNLFLSACVAILCYPIIGTPFPYQHSLILSIVSILIFYLAVIKEKKKYWFILPFIMLFSFLSMQLPSGLINLLIIIFLIIFFLITKNKNLIFFLAGSIVSLFILFLYFIITKVSIYDFITQMILFPLDVGLGRIAGDKGAFESAKLTNKLTFRGTFGHFKFIFFFIFANATLILINFKKNRKNLHVKKKILINILVLLCSLSFLFHQLITANQTFIFCLIPILGGLFILQVDEHVNLKLRNKIKFFVIILVAFSTIKYHFVYNEKRKFIDLQNVVILKAVNADLLSPKFNKLKWITPSKYYENPLEELRLIREAIKIIKSDKREKMLITHYQFFSLILNENLNIPNRWYYSNNTFPISSENIYYDKYIEKFYNKVNQREIK